MELNIDLDLDINFEGTRRGILIDTIMEYAGDEYENRRDYIELAKRDEGELYAQIQSIIYYYQNIDKENNEVSRRTEALTRISEYLLII